MPWLLSSLPLLCLYDTLQVNCNVVLLTLHYPTFQHHGYICTITMFAVICDSLHCMTVRTKPPPVVYSLLHTATSYANLKALTTVDCRGHKQTLPNIPWDRRKHNCWSPNICPIYSIPKGV
jgi:hypothetical protein